MEKPLRPQDGHPVPSQKALAWKEDAQILGSHGSNGILLPTEQKQGMAVEPQGRHNTQEGSAKPHLRKLLCRQHPTFTSATDFAATNVPIGKHLVSFDTNRGRPSAWRLHPSTSTNTPNQLPQTNSPNLPLPTCRYLPKSQAKLYQLYPSQAPEASLEAQRDFFQVLSSMGLARRGLQRGGHSNHDLRPGTPGGPNGKTENVENQHECLL